METEPNSYEILHKSLQITYAKLVAGEVSKKEAKVIALLALSHEKFLKYENQIERMK